MSARAAVKPARQRADGLGLDAGDRGGPGGVLRLAVRLAQKVALEDGPAGGVAVEEGAIVQPFRHQRMDERQHQGGVRAGDAADPARAGLVRKVAAQRADEDELAAARAGAIHGAALDMPADAAARHHAVLQRHAAEGDDDLAVLGHLFPGDVVHGQIHVIAEDVRHDHGGGAGAVAVDGLHVAAERRVQETVDLALGVVEAAGARPAIGAAEHRAGTVGVANAAQLGAEQVERLVPGQRHELVASPAVVGPGSAVEPAAADHRLRDARPMMQRPGEILDDAVGIGVILDADGPRAGPSTSAPRTLPSGTYADETASRLPDRSLKTACRLRRSSGTSHHTPVRPVGLAMVAFSALSRAGMIAHSDHKFGMSI